MKPLRHTGTASTDSARNKRHILFRRRRWALFGVLAASCLLIWILAKRVPMSEAGAIVSAGMVNTDQQTQSAQSAMQTDDLPFADTADSMTDSTPSEPSSPVGTATVSPSAILSATQEVNSSIPKGFVHVADEIPSILIEMRYYGSSNFVGRPIAGYEANTAILTDQAAAALARVQKTMIEKGLTVLIYDAYRPTTAVADFVKWAGDLSDTATKEIYYPNLEKERILRDGYIARKSSHSRGSTVDLTLADQRTGLPLDMGCSFDRFGKESDPDYKNLTKEQSANRKTLRDAMEAQGFILSTIEWWHFRLKDEPFPKTFFDFPVR